MMKDQKSSADRRKLLKSIAVGSGAVAAGKSLPESWSKPVIDAIVLPAHAALTDDTGSLPGDTPPVTTTTLAPVCCEGVFCRLKFNDAAPILGAAQVRSDCSITMEGDSITGNWSGSGTVAADGSFSFDVIFTGVTQGLAVTTTAAPQMPRLVTGTLAADCSTISGTMESYGAFGASVTPGTTDINSCNIIKK